MNERDESNLQELLDELSIKQYNRYYRSNKVWIYKKARFETMQAFKAYYNDGRFVPIGIGKLQEGTQAIITILDEPIVDNENSEAWQEFLQEIKKIDDEPLVEFEQVKFREVDI